jgi:hypothetical protein
MGPYGRRMKLAKPFYRLPVRFDARRLREETAALPPTAWAKHPKDYAGNSSVRLISAAGGENDYFNGVMLPTPHLMQSPYIRQVLASFGVVWGRSRLMKLAPFAGVRQHADAHHHWFDRVRVHIPVVTHPDVRFYCGSDSVHMAEGEAWVFDNWRLHRVENPVDAERVHLVADTSGNAAFWQLVARSESPTAPPYEHHYDAGRDAEVLTERAGARPVMQPSEVDLLLLDLQTELVAPPDAAAQEQLAHYRSLLDAFRHDWRQLYQLFGEDQSALPKYAALRDNMRRASTERSQSLTMRTNDLPAHNVLEVRVLASLLIQPQV